MAPAPAPDEDDPERICSLGDLPIEPNRVVGHTFGGAPILVGALIEALGHVYSGDQTLEAHAFADALQDMGLSVTREPDRVFQKRLPESVRNPRAV